jgi:flagellar hook-associated protein 3 FlgL
MRITNSILHRTALGGVTRGLSNLEEATRKVTSGLRVERPSDDPVATSGIMRSSSGLRAIDQYLRNLSTAESRLAVEDDVLNQLGNVLSRARELGVGQGTDTATTQTRLSARVEVNGLIETVRALGNSRLGEAWVFGGDEAHRPPFSEDPLVPLPGGEGAVEIAAGQTVQTAHSAQTIFADTGALDALARLAGALEQDSRPAIAEALVDLEAAFSSVQQLVGEVGGRLNRVDVARENLTALDTSLRTHRSDLQDIELEEAMSDLVRQQVAYQTALASNARILSLNLTDYLR